MTFRADSHPFFSGDRPRILAHRGFHQSAPENSRSAFAAAIELGVTHIETDVVASRDGIAIVCHDLVLDRVARDSGNVADRTATELATVDIGGEGFMTLREALAAFPQAKLNIDIKDERAIADTARAIADTDAAERVLVTSFSESRRRSAAELMSEVASSASGAEFLRIFGASRFRFTPPLPRIHALQIPARAYGIPTVTRTLVDRYHRLGLEVHVWTVNDEAEMRRLIDVGVDGIVTDRADIALRTLRG